jgi:transposase InsO family protein
VVGRELLNSLQWTETIDQPYLKIRGIGGASSISGWAAFQIQLESTETIMITAAITERFGILLILGMPFFTQLQVRLDFGLNILETRKGIIELYTKNQMAILKVFGIETEKIEVLAEASQTQLETHLKSAELGGVEKNKFYSLLAEFRDLWEDGRRGCTTRAQHIIKVTTPYAIINAPRRIGLRDQEIIDKEVEQMLKDEVIEPSNSPHSSEPVLIQKRTGEIRFCIDYRKLNRFTIPDSFPLRRIDDLLGAIRGSRYFVALDLRSGYWQIPLEDASRAYSAFRTAAGLFQFRVMPFGLCNAPATFQRCMEAIFGDLHWKGVLIYLDDILIHASTVIRVFELVRIVFERLRISNLTINLKKCQFFPTQMLYLGHIVGGGELKPNPARVESLYKIKPPTCVADVRSVLGCFGYYRQYLPKFAERVESITRLLKKGAIFIWTDEMTVICRQLAVDLATAVLVIPVEGDRFKIETDASSVAVGAILSVGQGTEWRPVEFASKTLQPAQRNWAVREKEAYAIIWAVAKFDSFVRGRKFDIYTDHESLQFLMTATEGKLARWACRLAEYDFCVHYQKGKNHMHVDFFSRLIQDEEVEFPDHAFCMWAEQDESSFPSVLEVMREQKKTPCPTGKGYSVRNGIVFYRNGLWPPVEMRNRIIFAAHHALSNWHSGIKKTKTQILKVFNWTNLHLDVTMFVKGCLGCQRLRPGTERLQGLFRTHPETGPFERIYIDFWGPCGYQRKQFILLTIIDHFTRWAECLVITDKESATVAHQLHHNWFARWGFPTIMVTDRDPSFVSEVFEESCVIWGIKHLKTTPAHPEGNSPIESFHRALRKGLTHFQFFRRDAIPFEAALDLVLAAYRATPHSTTGDTPYFLVTGMDFRAPRANDWRFYRTSAMQDRMRFISLLRLDIAYQAHRRRLYQLEQAQPGRTDRQLEIGELVLVHPTEAETRKLLHQAGGKKLLPKWSTPYRVIRTMSGGKAALVRCLLTHRYREVHIQNVRFISKPTTPEQEAEWKEHLTAELEHNSMYDRDRREKILEQFFQEVSQPSKGLAGEPDRACKRPRQSFEG